MGARRAIARAGLVLAALSNDATAWLGAPLFAAASFRYDGRSLELAIGMHY